ncbi:autotransporter domain-containing protein [Cyanobium sp. Candia 9D4]|nr:autotransporter domain-containing protein [Cyanobium sp. Candia 9D4]
MAFTSYSVRLSGDARVSVLTNAQASSPLTYFGALPGTYNVVVQSLSNRGRLSVFEPSGTMTFGIDPSSSLAVNRYTNILTGVAASAITNEDTQFAFGLLSWRLSAGSETNSWDLIVSTKINPSQTYHEASQLGAGLLPDFESGTLRVDQANGSYAQNFTLDSSSTNRIDQYGNAATFSGVFSDAVAGTAGNLAIVNSASGGRTTFTGANTFTGTTTIENGATLEIGNGGTTGSISNASNIINNASLVFNRSNDYTYTGVVSGTGRLIQSGGGVLNLNGINLYTGSTTVAAGSGLAVNGSIAASSGLTVNAGATIKGTGTLPATSVLSGGILAPGNSIGTLTFNGDLSLSSGSISSFEVGVASADQVVSTGSIALGGTLNLNFGNFDGAPLSSYTLFSAPTISSQFSSINATGLSSFFSYGIQYTGNSVLLSVLRGMATGTTTDITNVNSTIFSGGTLVVNSPGLYTQNWLLGAEATSTVDLDGNRSVFSGIFSDLTPGQAGSITFSNPGFLSLTGNSTYTGSTTVANGATLSVNGSIASSSELTVQPGSTIGGSGSLPQTNLVAGAQISPGNSIGTITAAGLRLNGGTINAEIQGPQNDKISVIGDVTNVTGSVNLMAYGGGSPWPNFSYNIITAGNGFATSNSLTLNPSGISSALLTYGTNLVQEVDGNASTFDVQWQPRNGSGATASALSSLGKGQRNQLAMAGAFDRVFAYLATAAGNQPGTTTGANATGTAIGTTGFTSGQAAAAGVSSDFLTATSELLGLTSGSQLAAAIDSLSPEPYAAYQAVGLATLKRQRELLFSLAGNCQSHGWLINGPETRNGQAPERPVCVFAQASNTTSSIRGQEGLSSYDAGIFSSVFGLEYALSRQWSVGAAYGYGTSNLDDMSLTSANVSADVNGGAFYAVYRPTERWTIKGLLGYSSFAVDGSRNVASIGNGSTIHGATAAKGYTAAIHASYDILINAGQGNGSMRLKPIAGLAWGGYQQNGFTESDGGALNLRVDGNTASSLVATLGMELAFSPIALSQDKVQSITPRLAVAYQLDALANSTGNKSLNATFVAAPSAGSFSTQGENGGANALTVTGGVDVQLARNASLYATVNYQVESNGSQFGYGGGLRIQF